MNRFLIFLILVLLATWLQSSYFTIAGVRPNLILAVFAALSFLVESFWTYSILSLISIIALRYSPVFSWELMAFWLAIIAIFFLRRILPWHDAVNFIASVVGGTIGLYLLVAPMFIWSQPILVIFELTLTLAIGGLTLLLLHRYAEASGLKF